MRNRLPNTRTNAAGPQRGYTLLEILLALAVVAILSFVVFRAYTNTKNSAEVRSAVSDIGTIQASLNNIYPNGYTGLSTSVANQAHVFPTDMNANNFTGGAPITNQWNGAVTLTVGATSNEYTLTYNAVPSAACVQLAAQAGQNAIAETVGGTNVFNSSNQPDPGLIAGACNVAATEAVAITGD